MGVPRRSLELGRCVRTGSARAEGVAVRHGASTARPVGPAHDEPRALGHGRRLGPAVRALASRTSTHEWLLALGLGPAAWLTSYAVLPLVKVYDPIWKYYARTLGKALSAHLAYGPRDQRRVRRAHPRRGR